MTIKTKNKADTPALHQTDLFPELLEVNHAVSSQISVALAGDLMSEMMRGTLDMQIKALRCLLQLGLAYMTPPIDGPESRRYH